MTTTKLTPRQFEALESLLVNGSPHMKRDSYRHEPDKVFWSHVRRAGGSQTTILNALESARVKSRSLSRIDPDIAKEFGEYGSKVTAAGLELLIANSKDPAVVELAKGRLPERRETEAAIEAALKVKADARNATYAASEKRRRERHLSNLRELLARYDLDAFGSSLTDDGLLAFADEVEGSQHGSYERNPA